MPFRKSCYNSNNPSSKLKFPTSIDLHKLLVSMVKPNSCWYYEVSTTAPQYAFHKLAKAVADMGFYEFRRQYKYKCQLYGSKLTIVDRWFPSSKTCSRCGTVKESLLLSERVFNCEHCNFSCDLDLNAGLNLAMAVSSTVTACGLDNADVARMKQK